MTTLVRVAERSVALTALLLLLTVLQLVPSSSASHYENDDLRRVGTRYKYHFVCPENELLQDTIPCCEPTCDNNCSTVRCSEVRVHQPSCVCKPDFVRYKSKCIPKCHCPVKPPTPPNCEENEELLPSPPCCEPTCTDDCSDCACRTRYVDQPTCVCKDGYRRHHGKCIRIDKCPTCGPYATLTSCAPCCEPTCDNDCSNVMCISACNPGEPVCVCQQGYVKHNSTCIKRELCPKKKLYQPRQYYRCRGRKNKPTVAPSVPVVYHYLPTVAPPTCDCHLPELIVPVYYKPQPTQAPVTPRPTCCPTTPPPPIYPTAATCPPPSPAPPTPAPYPLQCSCQSQQQPSCLYAPTTPVPYYKQPASSYLQDQPYYAIPALQQCNCGGFGQPAREYYAPPISYKVDTPVPGTSTVPPPCPNPTQDVYYNVPPPFCPYQAAAPRCACNQPDQAYIQNPGLTERPPPIDVTFIDLPDPCFCGQTTTPTPAMMCFGAA